MSRCILYSLVLVTACFAISLAKPTEESRQSRIHDGKLSKEDHFSATGEHNTEYDHDAFLGSEKKEFDKRKPEESKKWLA